MKSAKKKKKIQAKEKQEEIKALKDDNNEISRYPVNTSASSKQVREDLKSINDGTCYFKHENKKLER